MSVTALAGPAGESLPVTRSDAAAELHARVAPVSPAPPESRAGEPPRRRQQLHDRRQKRLTPQRAIDNRYHAHGTAASAASGVPFIRRTHQRRSKTMCHEASACTDPGRPRPTEGASAETTMTITRADGTSRTIELSNIPFDLAEYVAHDEHGRHIWRFDESQRWGRGGHAIVARRHPGYGDKHVEIRRGFDWLELPYLIAFLVSLWDELDEPPF